MAFAAYLRLKGHRSHREVAAQTCRPLGVIRRLSARFNWPGRVAAFEARRAEAAQAAIEASILAVGPSNQADYERLQLDMFRLAQRMLAESGRWIQLATDRRRRNISLGQVLRIIRLASLLGRLSTGLPLRHDPPARRRGACVSAPQRTVEQALEVIYGSATKDGSTSAPGKPAPGGEVASGVSPPAQPAEGSVTQTVLNVATVQPAAPSLGPPYRRRDAWSAWAQQQCRAAAMQGRWPPSPA